MRAGQLLATLLALAVGATEAAGCAPTRRAEPPVRPATAQRDAGGAPPGAVISIAAGGDDTCAITRAGRVLCWGENGMSDPLRLGERKRATSAPVAIRTPGGKPSFVAVTPQNLCVLDAQHELSCRGDAEDPETGATNVWTGAVGPGVRAVAVSALFGCAVAHDGNVMCWGDGGRCQLGGGCPSRRSAAGNTPPVVATPKNPGATSVVVGNTHACALTSQGTALCWGGNRFGQTGVGIVRTVQTPTLVAGLKKATALAAGHDHTCALVADGRVMCWGRNNHGQLGNGSADDGHIPVAVSHLDHAVAIAAGGDHTCALLRGGRVFCWGADEYGQLGDHAREARYQPVPVERMQSGVTAIAVGDEHSCALLRGHVWCWGRNRHGQLGNGAELIGVHGPVAPPSMHVTAIAARGNHSCFVGDKGQAMCCGDNHAGRLGNNSTEQAYIPVKVAGASWRLEGVYAGGGHTCGVVHGGGAICWGDNSYGQLGNRSTSDQHAPIPVLGLGSAGVTAMALGARHSCALAHGHVWCWGANGMGELGNNSTARRSAVPVRVTGVGSGIKAISAGAFHTCALDADDHVMCWGYNVSGQLGNRSTDSTYENETCSRTPVRVMGLGGQVRMLASGGAFNCVLRQSGDVECWGDNRHGQLGNNTLRSGSTVVAVHGLPSSAVTLAAGAEHACALLQNGSVMCWGRNRRGQLGDGSMEDSKVPVRVRGLDAKVVSLAAGTDYTLALTQSGRVLGWGDGADGQLGDNSSTVPVRVTGL